jgi:hypothetical protein
MPPRCSDYLRSKFLDEPTYVQLHPGEHLYKFVSLPIVRHHILASPWWIRQETFDVLRQRAQRLSKPMLDLVRSQMAIAVEWNPGMDTIYVVVLAANVDAWEGRARSQRVSTRDGKVAFTGGGSQLAVPDLTWSDIGLQFSGWPPG